MSNQTELEAGVDPQKALAAALGRVPSGLFIVTVRHGEAETGMLASWVQQCSFDPPQISVAIRRDRAVCSWLEAGARFTVNILGEGQSNYVAHFGKGFRLDEPAFTGLSVLRPNGAAPVLADALGYLLCELETSYPAGDHDLFIGNVMGGQLQGESRPLIHVRKNGLRY